MFCDIKITEAFEKLTESFFDNGKDSVTFPNAFHKKYISYGWYLRVKNITIECILSLLYVFY